MRVHAENATKEETTRTNLATRLIINFLQKIITKLTRRKREIMVTEETKTIVLTRSFSCSGVLTVRWRTKKPAEIPENNNRNVKTTRIIDPSFLGWRSATHELIVHNTFQHQPEFVPVRRYWYSRIERPDHQKNRLIYRQEVLACFWSCSSDCRVIDIHPSQTFT